METEITDSAAIITDEPGGVKPRAERAIANRIARRELWLLVAATPLLLFPGPWSWAGLGLILLAWLTRWLATGRLTVRTGLGPPVLLLGLMTVVGFAVAPDRAASQEALWRTVLGLAWFFGLANLNPDATTLRRLGWLWIAAGAGLALLTVVGTDWQNTRLMHLAIYDVIPKFGLYDRLGALGNARGMGMALAIVAPVLLALALMGRGKVQRITALLVALLMVPMLVLTQSVQGALGLAFAVALVLLIWKWWTLLAVIPLAAIAIWTGSRVDWHTLALTSLDIKNAAGIAVVLRLDIWSRALAMIRDMPLTGIGLDSYQIVQTQFYPGYLLGPEFHAHNLFMQTALDMGLVGLLGFLWLLAALAAMVIKALRHHPNPMEKALLAGTAAGIAAMLGSGLIDSFWGFKLSLLFWLVLGTAVLAARAVAQRTETGAAFPFARRWHMLAGVVVLIVVLGVATNPGIWSTNLGLVNAHQALLSARTTGSPDTGRLQGARDRLLAANADIPGNPQIYDELASLDAWLGDEEAALAALRQRLTMEGGDPMARYAPWEPWRRQLLDAETPKAADDLLRIYSQWMVRYPDRAEGYVRVALVWDRLAGNRTQAVAVLHDGLTKGAQPAGLLNAALAQLGETAPGSTDADQ